MGRDLSPGPVSRAGNGDEAVFPQPTGRHGDSTVRRRGLPDPALRALIFSFTHGPNQEQGMHNVLLVSLAVFVLIACVGCGGQGVNRTSAPGVEPVFMYPAELDPEVLGPWASFTQDHFRVGETNRTDSGSDWMVQGTPTGLVDNLPQCTLPCKYTYTGHVWGRVYGGYTGRDYHIDTDDGDRVSGIMTATYGPRDHYGPGADDVLNVFLNHMYKELPNGGRSFLPGMIFRGDVGTDRRDPDYDPALDTATFTLSAEQYDGSEEGTATGRFYGPNGEALGATFWYRRDGHRIEGVFGGELDQ